MRQPRGRPRRARRVMRVRITLSLDAETDSDLIAAFEHCPRRQRPALVKRRMRDGAPQETALTSDTDDAAASALLDSLLE